MRAFSITKIDADGRVILPASIREGLSLSQDEEMALDLLPDGTLALGKVNSKIRFDRWLNG